MRFRAMIGGTRFEIDLGGVKVPAIDWEATPESIKRVYLDIVRQLNERVAKLETENEQSRQRVAELEEKQGSTRRNRRHEMDLEPREQREAVRTSSRGSR